MLRARIDGALASACPDRQDVTSGRLLGQLAPWLRLPFTTPGMRIGLLGGSFNPAHAGHRHISLEAMARLDLDRVWWLVSPGNPLKSREDLASQETRIRRAEAVAMHPRIDVTGFESALGTPYTAEVLAQVARQTPGRHLVWLMGADNLASFHRWRHWERIAGLTPFAVLDRPGWRSKALHSQAASALARFRLPESAARELALAPPPAWTFLSIPLNALSSTALRRQNR